MSFYFDMSIDPLLTCMHDAFVILKNLGCSLGKKVGLYYHDVSNKSTLLVYPNLLANYICQLHMGLNITKVTLNFKSRKSSVSFCIKSLYQMRKKFTSYKQ